MFEWLGISAVNPALLAGAALIASPIIIHLLSRRKFKVIEWAAMDFLLDADKRNRRRVRLENFLLLLLRCLAVILIALLVARPFSQPRGLASQVFKDSNLERVVLLDDSPSMQLRSGKAVVFDECKENLVKFVRDLSTERSGDTFTLILTSQPESPVFNGQYLGAEQAEEVVRKIEQLNPSDVAAQMDQSLLAVEDALKSSQGRLNRVVYLVTDLRRRDWITGPDVDKDRSAAGILRRISESVQGCFLIDMGNESTDNLLVTSIEPRDKMLVAGVDSQFNVVIANNGDKSSEEFELKLYPGEGLELTKQVKSIPARSSESVPLTFSFRDPGSVSVRAEIASPDPLPVDNERFFAARVHEGMPILLVERDAGEDGRPKTPFLERALNPPGEVRSGNVVDAINENQFENYNLSKYKVIILSNVYRPSEERLASLEAWVKAGGGLVILLGDQVDEQTYNSRIYDDGKGLSPVRLIEIRGDESEQKWVHFSVESPNHPVMGLFEGADNLAVKAVSIFRWWGVEIPAGDVMASKPQLVATFDDPDSSPAMIEKGYGNGRVLVMTTPMDGDWGNWPSEPSFAITALEMVQYMARPGASEGNALVGTPLRYEVDPAIYKSDAKLTAPKKEATTVQAVTPLVEEGAAENRNQIIDFDETASRGLYKLELTGRDGEPHPILFAANLDPSEGDLRRLEDRELRTMLEGAQVQVDRGKVSLSVDATGGKAEVWPKLLVLLGIVLCGEQALAWLFGRQRQ